MIIYHGSADIISEPLYNFGKRYNDYGPGFYCTFDKDLAKEWAAKNNTDGYVNSYRLDLDSLSVLYLNSAEYNILHWLTVLLQNRTFSIKSTLAAAAKEYLLENFFIDYSVYDLIHGYRADDSYFSFAQDFLSGTISFRQLSEAMYLGELGNQIVLKSRKAFSMIEFVGAEPVKAGEWYPKVNARDRDARNQYLNVNRHGLRDDDIYVIDLIRGRIKPDDPSLQRTVPAKRAGEPGGNAGLRDA